jgi:hypothetical protein
LCNKITLVAKRDTSGACSYQGCQMVCFQTKNPNLGKFWRVHFTVFCYILWIFGIISGNLAYFSRFGILYQEKSGNPGSYLNRFQNMNFVSDKCTLRTSYVLSRQFLSHLYKVHLCTSFWFGNSVEFKIQSLEFTS